MVRCLVAIIELVGDGLEAPDVVDALLDVARSPRRPQYVADEAPLCSTTAPSTVRRRRRGPAAAPRAPRASATPRAWRSRARRTARELDGPRRPRAEVPWARAPAAAPRRRGRAARAAHRPLLAREGGRPRGKVAAAGNPTALKFGPARRRSENRGGSTRRSGGVVDYRFLGARGEFDCPACYSGGGTWVGRAYTAG